MRARGAGRRQGALVAVLLALLVLPAAQPPGDPLVAQQTHLPVVRAFEAWDVRRGEGAVVAVLDTGVDLDHPDLVGRLVEGIDLVEPDTEPDDPQGHGTIVAGVIAAVADNGRGVTGVSPQAQVMPIRVLDAEGRGTSDVVAEGIRHAVEQGVQVINLSLAEIQQDHRSDSSPGRGTSSAPLLDGVSLVNDREVVAAIEEAWEAGIMVVAAAGNDGLSTTPYDRDTPVVVVGATDTEDEVWEDSNHDDRTLFAPGVEILSTWSDARYARSDGTSFATPIVAAGAAMLMGAGLTAEDAVRRLVDTAVPLSDDVGLGRIDLAAAVQGLAPAPPTEPPPPPPPSTSAPAPSGPAGSPPGQPPAQQVGPTPTDGPLEVAEPVVEVQEPAPTQVSEPPPPIAVQPIPTTPIATPDQLALEPAEAVVDPAATRTPAPLLVAPDPSGTARTDRSMPLMIATALLGLDVMLAGWVLAGRR